MGIIEVVGYTIAALFLFLIFFTAIAIAGLIAIIGVCLSPLITLMHAIGGLVHRKKS
jgi:hypothetical protein